MNSRPPIPNPSVWLGYGAGWAFIRQNADLVVLSLLSPTTMPIFAACYHGSALPSRGQNLKSGRTLGRNWQVLSECAQS